METFDRYILGETDEVMLAENSDQLLLATLKMTGQCRNTIDIISRKLDPVIYENGEFLDLARAFVLRHRRTRLRILVYEAKEIVRKGHRLVDMAGTLSSFIQIRTLNEDYKDFNESLFVVDKTGYIHRLNSDRYESTLNFNDKSVSKHLLNQFNEIWDRSEPDPNIRRFHI